MRSAELSKTIWLRNTVVVRHANAHATGEGRRQVKDKDTFHTDGTEKADALENMDADLDTCKRKGEAKSKAAISNIFKAAKWQHHAVRQLEVCTNCEITSKSK